MSFWKLSTGEDARNTDGTFEMGGGDFEPIPNETNVLAVIEEAKWDNKDGNHFVSVRWSVLAPSEYKNRKIFQKLWIKDHDPRAKDPVKKKDKAIKMFAAIDKNCGGKVMSSEEEPTDEKLGVNFCGKSMIAVVMQWKMPNEQTGEEMKGNWIQKVTARANGETVSITTAPKLKVGKSFTPEPPEEDVPF